ncbi:MFS transporter [Actinotalea subterranea]|uniref:MFS transporter n=1 Tax=Actinotalea subterranea TaxID=2607497 RepID=UPI00165E3C8B|nr:MFS transporter [Actinotalea subterranea]
MTAGASRFVRDRLTVTLYTPFITWGWFLYCFSPAVPLIADEQGISRGLAGLHGTTMAAGTIATGLFSSRVAERFGRKTQALAGGVVLVVGILMLVSGTTLAATLLACFVTSVGGNLTISAAQPALVVHQHAAGAAAVTEANAMGAAIGLLAPLALGACVGLGWGWRPAVAFVVVLAVAAALALVPIRGEVALDRGERRLVGPVAAGAVGTVIDLSDDDAPAEAVAGPAAGPAPATTEGFGRTFWMFWVAMLCGVAIEFSTTFWASDLLIARTDAPASVATASVSALVGGMAVSRFIVGPLSVRKAPEKLLLVGFTAAGLGWLVFWLATSPVVAVAGLVLAGLGYGTHYPLTVALALRASGGRPDRAQARASLGTGGAVAVAPFLLGALADSFGAHQAFVLVPVLIVIGGTAVLFGMRSVRRDGRLARAAL